MLEKIKLDLRINNSFYDDEIKDLIEACKLDLKISGIASSLIKDDDPLIIQAIKIYCKAHFGFDNSDSEKLKENYSLLKQHLAIAYHENTDELQKIIGKEGV
jgi:hypothetical protein|nr:MAG TPA_asm: head to tail adaptor [Caudoviricetes sp.]